MADGEITLKLDEALSGRLAIAAEARGRPPAAYAIELIADALEDEWSEAERRWLDFEKTGESVSVNEAMDKLERNLKARFAAKRLATLR